MKNNLLFSMAMIVAVMISPSQNFAQAPNLGTAANFVLFTTTGAVGSTGISNVTGNVGTGTGAITGFAGLNGLIYNADAVTTQASADLLVAYNELNNDIPTFFPGPVLGNGQILTAGVYSLPAAGSLNSILYLDAQGDPNAVFIFQIGGAFSTAASSQVFLMNGALAANIFWKAEGAVPMAAGTIMRGTIIANNGAISMGAGGLLEGRALSTTGAVSIYGTLAYILPGGGATLAINLFSFTGFCDNQNIQLNWSTASETNSLSFSVERSTEKITWQVIETMPAEDHSSQIHAYAFTDKLPLPLISYYRLKQTDLEGNADYGKVIQVKKCGENASEKLTAYPNPSSSGKFALLYNGDKSQVVSINVFNALGEKISQSNGFQTFFDLSGQSTGEYFIQMHLYSGTITQKVIVND